MMLKISGSTPFQTHKHALVPFHELTDDFSVWSTAERKGESGATEQICNFSDNLLIFWGMFQVERHSFINLLKYKIVI